jgi:hypothetical protein
MGNAARSDKGKLVLRERRRGGPDGMVENLLSPPHLHKRVKEREDTRKVSLHEPAAERGCETNGPGIAPAAFLCYFLLMGTANEIEVAIRALSPIEREKLIKDLPGLLPELDGDMAWNRIIGDARSRPELAGRG